MVVTTDFPRRISVPGISSLHGSPTTFNLEYVIKAPRNAQLVIDHNEGEVHLDGLAGNIQAATRQGQITVHVTGDSPRTINAYAKAGSVNSDFPGKETRRHWLGHRFVADNSTGTQKLDLKAGYGDIVILKLHKTPLPTPVTP